MSEKPQNIYFVSLGCSKNQVDTEVMLGLVDQAGYRRVAQPEDADAIVVNTCGFIESAKQESIETILELGEHKAGRCQKLVVTGCLVQSYADELSAEMPEIDHLLGSSDFGNVVSVLKQPRRGVEGGPLIDVSKRPLYIYNDDTPRIPIGARHSTYVKIAEGCDRPCAFCAIPNLRGKQRSRTIESVYREAENLVAAGTVEINLIAQDLTRYGSDLDDNTTLARLLYALSRISGLRWIRLHYTYPTAFSDELIEVIASRDNIVSYVDVPLQHIDDGVLKAMRRGYRGKAAWDLVQRLRNRIDDLVLRTTVLVGHPGESEDAYKRLVDFVGETEFDHLGVFTYSREPNTVAAMLPARVQPEIAEARREALLEMQRVISANRLQRLVGQDLEVLVDGPSEESEFLLEGRYYGQAPDVDGVVYLADGTAKPGEFVTAQVTQSADYDLAATLDPDVLAQTG